MLQQLQLGHTAPFVIKTEPLSLVRHIITTMNGIVYQWNKQPNVEILMGNKSVQYLKPAKSYKEYC